MYVRHFWVFMNFKNWIFDTFVDLQENKQQTIRHGIIHCPKNSPLIIIFLKNIEKKFWSTDAKILSKVYQQQ